MIHKETNERARIERVIEKEGVDGAIRWARRTAGIYRAAVLDRGHFAHAGACRRQFIKAYLELKRFAARGTL